MKKAVVNLLYRALKEMDVKLKKEQIESLLEVPPSIDMGDYAFPCFSLAGLMKQEPDQIALQIRERIGNEPVTDFDDIQTKGPYVNFFLDRKNLARKVVWEVITQKRDYGRINLGKNKKVVVEFSSPNIAKPFGIGHIRSTIIGNSIANICEFMGYKPVRINYLGDWGTQFGKLMFGYNKFGSEAKLKKDPIQHLFDIYVKANKKSYEEKSREWFKKLENKDVKAQIMWRLFRELSLEEFKKIYDTFNIKFDEYDGESLQTNRIKKVITELNTKRLLKKSEGALIIDLKQYNLGVALIQKSDGATLYATRDLAAAIHRYKTHKFKKMIYEVGQEQKLYFKQLFKILELMGYKWAKDCIHVEHGLYLDKNRKKFATRKGKTVFVEDILEETQKLARKEIKKRFPTLPDTKLEERSMKVALAAIFYGDLKNNRQNNIVFDLKKFVSFEGDTGPYILYSYARASSILRKAEREEKFKIGELHDKELELVKKLLQFPDIVLSAYNHLNPSLIATYAYQLSQNFNEFYHTCPVIGSEEEAYRLALVEAFRQVTKNAMKLLGIEVLEKM
ncbi:MAG: arginine--tRNA ligase [archaeon]